MYLQSNYGKENYKTQKQCTAYNIPASATGCSRYFYGYVFYVHPFFVHWQLR